MEYKSSKSKKIVIFSVVGAMVAVVVGLTLFFVLSDDGNSASVTEERENAGKIVDAGTDLVYWEQGNFPSNPGGVISEDVGSVTELSSSVYSYWAIDASGYLYTWGDDRFGQLGLGSDADGTPVNDPTPVDVNGNGILDIGDQVIAAGMDLGTSWAITKDNNYLYTWGSNDYGQLGYQTENNIYNPTPQVVNISDLNNTNTIDSDDSIQSFDISDGTSIALSNRGYLYSWGYNGSGSLGRYMDIGSINKSFWKSEPIDLNESGNLSSQDKVSSYGLSSTYSPYDMTGEDAPASSSTYADDKSDKFGQTTAWAINQDGYLYMWGSNEYNQIQNNFDYINGANDRYVLIPTLVNNLNNAFTNEIQLYNDVTVSSGVTIFEKQKMDISSQSEFYISGSDKYWTQGKFTSDNGNYYSDTHRKTEISSSDDAQIYSSNLTTTAEGLSTYNELKPQKVYYPEYSGTLMMIDEDGNLYTLGNNSENKLGLDVDSTNTNNDTYNAFSPVDFSGVTSSPIVEAGGGYTSSWAIDSEGYLFYWGDTNNTPEKVSMNGLPEKVVKSESFEEDQQMVITENGDLFMKTTDSGKGFFKVIF